MKSFFELALRTTKRAELINITSAVGACVRESGIRDGICVVFVPHTTAGVTINENADPDVCRDINAHLGKIIPKDPSFTHNEGNSDAHIKTSLVGSSLTIIIEDGNLYLGTWQGIYFSEFDGPRSRTFAVKCLAG